MPLGCVIPVLYPGMPLGCVIFLVYTRVCLSGVYNSGLYPGMPLGCNSGLYPGMPLGCVTVRFNVGNAGSRGWEEERVNVSNALPVGGKRREG